MIRPKVELDCAALKAFRKMAAQEEKNLQTLLAELLILGYQHKIGLFSQNQQPRSQVVF